MHYESLAILREHGRVRIDCLLRLDRHAARACLPEEAKLPLIVDQRSQVESFDLQRHIGQEFLAILATQGAVGLRNVQILVLDDDLIKGILARKADDAIEVEPNLVLLSGVYFDREVRAACFQDVRQADVSVLVLVWE